MKTKALTVSQFKQYLTSHCPTEIVYNDCKRLNSAVRAYLFFDEIIILPSSPSTINLNGNGGKLTVNNVTSVKVKETDIGAFIALRCKRYANTEVFDLWIR